jgi:hypothetical protein
MAASPADIAVVNQMYRECLTSLFERDYYQELYNQTIKYSRYFDYSIGLGSAMSGGTGLGILANPNLAWLCGVVTTASVLLSIAKGIWDWPGKTKFALERIQFYEKLYFGYKALVDDVNVAMAWNTNFDQTRNTLRSSSVPPTPDPYPQFSLTAKQAIQNAIKKRITYTTWWSWKP